MALVERPDPLPGNAVPIPSHQAVIQVERPLDSVSVKDIHQALILQPAVVIAHSERLCLSFRKACIDLHSILHPFWRDMAYALRKCSSPSTVSSPASLRVAGIQSRISSSAMMAFRQNCATKLVETQGISRRASRLP